MPPDQSQSGRPPTAAQAGTRFDVFLSHSSRDKPTVERIAERLKRAGLEPWLDAWCLVPGTDWQDAIVEGLARSSSCAVFVSAADMGAWANLELKVALDRKANDPDFRLFLVLLPGLPEQFDASKLPPFLRMYTWVDYRDGLDGERAFHDFVCAVNGLPLGPAVPLAPQADVCPYRGLDVFDEEHADFFFGRDRDVQRLLEKLKGTRFLAVLGASGSGKSSLVRAGLVPALRRAATAAEPWEIAVLRPGARPLDSLAARLVRLGAGDGMQQTLDALAADPRSLHLATSLLLTDRAGHDRVLLVVDQFEEVFTLCRDERERRAFFASLLYAAAVPGGATTVVVTMRADFYHRCGAYPDLAQQLAAEQYLVSPMERDGLRQTIEEPARQVGLSLEPGLAQTILDDVAGQPGVLPLLEHALLELWKRRRGGMLTLAAYRKSGRVQGAIAQRADEVFAAFTPEQQELARRTFLRLTQPGEGTEDTRRRAPLAELATADAHHDLDVMLQRLVDARLLTTSRDDAVDEEVVEVAHEALIRGWPHLRAWIEEDRAGLRLHRRLTEAANEWERLERDPSALYRGARLAEALEWSTANESELNESEREFLDASSVAERSELEEMRRRARRLRTLAASLAAVGLAAAAAAVIAVQQRQTANTQRRAVSSASLLAAASSQNAHLDNALLLSLDAAASAPRRDEPTAQVENSIITALERARGTRAAAILHDDSAVANGVAYDPHGRLLAVASENGTVRLWDVRKHERLGLLDAGSHPVYAVAFDPSGDVLAGAGADGSVRLWDVASGRLLGRLREPASPIRSIAYRPGGGMLVAGTDRGDVWLWHPGTSRRGSPVYSADSGIRSVAFSRDGRIAFADGENTAFLGDATGSAPRSLPTLNDNVFAVAFSPNGRTLAIGRGHDYPNEVHTGAVQLWNTRTLTPLGDALRGPTGPTDFIEELAFSRDGTVAGAGRDGSVWLWNAVTKEYRDRVSGDAGHLHSVAFDPSDANRFAAAANDGEVLVWDLDHVPPLGGAVSGVSHDWPVTAVAFDGTHIMSADDGEGAVAVSSDGKEMAMLGARRTVRVSGAHSRTLSPAGKVEKLAFSHDGRWLAAASDGAVRVWSLDSGEGMGRLATGSVTSVAVADEGKIVATGDSDGTVRLWDVGKQQPLDDPLRGHSGAVKAIVFSPDARTLATGGLDAAIHLWDVDGRRELAALRLGGDVESLAFSADGRLLASGQDDGIRLWDTRQHVVLGPEALRPPTGSWTAMSVAFSADGSRLASGSDDRRVRVWNGILWSSFAELERQVCGLVFPPLTRDELRELAPGLGYRQVCNS